MSRTINNARLTSSANSRLTRRYAEQWLATHGPTDYLYRDLAATPIALLNTAFCALGRRVEHHGTVPLDEIGTVARTDEERGEWTYTKRLIDELLAADTVLIGAPMYNYSVSAPLKAWMDRVGFPGAFLIPGTRDSRLRNTRVVIVSARGGAPGPTLDFQTPYLRAYFGKQGIPADHVEFVTAELTLAELAPHLADRRPEASRSLARAITSLTPHGVTSQVGSGRGVG